MRNGTVLAAPVLLGVLALAGCQTPRQDPSPAAVVADTPPPYAPDATIKDLMINVVDTSADTVWLSVTATATDKGVIETTPQNEEDWLKVRQGAITLAEAANLLMIPGRHVARPGEKSETPGVELEPSEMETLIANDRASWNTRAAALHTAALAALRAAEAHDAGKIFEVGEQIENACENCHRQYWYPNEKIPDFPKIS